MSIAGSVALSMKAPVDEATTSLEALAKQSQAGDRQAFELLVKQLENRLIGFLYRMVGNSHDAADLAQDTFVKVYRNLHRYNPKYALTTWVFTIAKRTALNHFRASRPHTEFQPTTEIVEDHPASITESKDETQHLWTKARRLLTQNQFEAMWLRYGEEFSIDETAAIMQTNIVRVRVLLHRARAVLARHLAATHD